MAIQIRVTAEEFLALPESNQLRELIDGEIVVNPPKDVHQERVGNVYFYFRQNAKHGKARLAPTGLYVDEINFVEPDVFWVAESNTVCRLHDDGYWYGPPDLIVEVLSSSTIRNDRVTKFQLYERFGVREYWLVDAAEPSVEVWVLADGKFDYQGEYSTEQSFASTALGQTVDVNSLLTD